MSKICVKFNMLNKLKRGCSGILFFYVFFSLAILSANPLQNWKSNASGTVFQNANGFITARLVCQDPYLQFGVSSEVDQIVDAKTPVSFRYRITTTREILNIRVILIAENGTRYFTLINRPTPEFWLGESYVAGDFRDEKYRFIRSSTRIVSVGYEIHTQGEQGRPAVLDFKPVEFVENNQKIEGGSVFAWPKNGDRSPSNPPFIGWSRDAMKPVPTWLQVSQDSQFFQTGIDNWSANRVYKNYYTPNTLLSNGTWYARLGYDYSTSTGYSEPVRFIISDDSQRYLTPMLPEKIMAKRPYLFMDPALLARLRLEKDNVKKDWWTTLDIYVRETSYTFHPEEPEGFKNGVWDYETWRVIGNKAGGAESNIFISSLHYLLSGDTASAANARRIMMEVAKWDPDGSTGIKSVDHAAQGLLYSMSIGYDWLNDYLSEEDKKIVRNCIIARAQSMEAAMNPLMADPSNNHPWFCTAALGIAGLSLYNETPEARDWVDYTLQLYSGEFISLGGKDGDWHEGVAYWSYTLFFVFQFVDCLESATGIDLNTYPWLEKTARYKILAHPPTSFGVPFGDSKPMAPNYFDALIMARLAKVYQDPLAQWYVSKVKINSFISWYPYFIIWMDSNLKPEAPADTPLSCLWRDWGVGVTHSNLGSNENTMVSLRAGPYIGRRNGHSQADQNNFLIYAKGEPLLTDSGYYDPSGGVPYGGEHHMKWTIQSRAHNLPLVDGCGQALYTSGADGKMIHFLQQRDMSYMEGDASHPEIYQGRLDYFRRHLISLDSCNYLVWDELEAPHESRFDYLLHSNYPMHIDAVARKLTIKGKKSNMEVRFLNSEKLAYVLSSGFPIVPPRKNSWDFPDQNHFAAYPSPGISVDTVSPVIFGEPESFTNQKWDKLKSMDWLALFSVTSTGGANRVSIDSLEIEGGMGGKLYFPGQKYYYFFRNNGNTNPLSYTAKLPKSGKNAVADFFKSIITLNGEFDGKGVVVGVDSSNRVNRLILIEATSVKALGQTLFISGEPVTALVELTKTGTRLTVQAEKAVKAELVLEKKPLHVILDGSQIKEGTLWSYDSNSGKLILNLPEGTHQIDADVKS